MFCLLHGQPVPERWAKRFLGVHDDDCYRELRIRKRAERHARERARLRKAVDIEIRRRTRQNAVRSAQR